MLCGLYSGEVYGWERVNLTQGYGMLILMVPVAQSITNWQMGIQITLSFYMNISLMFNIIKILPSDSITLAFDHVQRNSSGILLELVSWIKVIYTWYLLIYFKSQLTEKKRFVEMGNLEELIFIRNRG